LDNTDNATGTSSSPENLVQQTRQLQDLARGYRQAQILLTCVELGVFEKLGSHGATAEALAVATRSDHRGMELLLNAAVALGLLEKREGKYYSTALTQACLMPGGPADITRSLQLERASYRRWEHLADAVRTGQRPEDTRRDEQPEGWARNFVYGLYAMARPMAAEVAQALALPEDRPLRVIDVGGGHGAYSLALAERYPHLTATIFELSRVVPVAREIVEAAGLASRVLVQEGDFQRDALGSGYDVALVFGVLNGEPPEGRPALVNKVFDALTPGGRIALRDYTLDSDRAGPPEAAIFALQLLLATDAGGLDTHADWAAWLTAAGFQLPQTVALPEAFGSRVVVAIKPGV
jgi:SAM-dependent methyltransferase